MASTQAVSQQPHHKNYVSFATGMNGDEDLGEDISMKGDKFHFLQNLPQPIKPFAEARINQPNKPFAEGMNGDEDLGEDITMKGDKFHFNQNLMQMYSFL